MKKILSLMAVAAVVLGMASCKPEEGNNPDNPGQETVVPQKITLADAFQEYIMSLSETATIQYTISPSNVNVDYSLAWTSSDEQIVKVDNKGKVSALREGSAEISVSIPEYPDVKAAVAKITVLAPAEVGDYLYSDGSWGKEANPSGKSVIAVIYWIGNASLFDPILEQDYPNCTHGLAMSLKQGKAEQWQKDFAYYYYGTDDMSDTDAIFKNMINSPLCDNSASLTEWGVVKSKYSDLIRPYFENEDMWAGDAFCGLGGYTYTAVLEEYTRTYADAGKYPFQFYLNGMNLVKGIEAPLTTSRWYMPSVFEAALMVNTALTRPKDFNNERSDEGGNPIINHNNDNLAVVNAALAKVSGAEQLPTESDYAIASATDAYMPFSSIANYMDCGDFFECCYVCNSPNGHNADEAAEIEKRWDDWLKENAGDKYEEYKAYTDSSDPSFSVEDRYEIYLTIRGYDSSLASQIGGDRIGVAISMLGSMMYGNVGVTTGKFHSNFFSSTYAPIISGHKGEDNEKDVVRAILAF